MAAQSSDLAHGKPQAEEHIEETKRLENDGLFDARDQFGAHSKVDPAEIKLVKKLDWYIMPTLWIAYFLNYLDRNAIVNARLNGLNDELGLVGNQYNTLISILFVGYLLGQIPSNMALTRIRPSRFIAGFFGIWGLVSLLTYLVQDYEGMLAARFMLGFTEAPFYPGALYIISIFYTRKETPTRMAILYSANMAAGSFSSLIAAGIFEGLDGVNGMSGWRWMFILQGAVTIACAIAAFWLLPDTPSTTRWLTPEERQLASARITVDTTEKREGTTVWTGLREATSDYRTWIFALIYVLHVASFGFQNFLPQLIRTFGYSNTISLVLACPPYLLGTIVSIVVAWTSGRYSEKTYHITVSKAIVATGFIICAASVAVPARFFAVFLFAGFSYGVNNILLSWAAATCGQTDEKKGVALALINMIGNSGSIFSPYLWPDSDSPRFLKAMLCSLAFCVTTVIMTWVMRFILKRENNRIRQDESEAVNFYVY